MHVKVLHGYYAERNDCAQIDSLTHFLKRRERYETLLLDNELRSEQEQEKERPTIQARYWDKFRGMTLDIP